VVVWEGDAEIYPDVTFSAMDNFRVSVSFETWGEQTVIAAPEPEPEKIKGPPAGKGWRK
jgi:hypothetical protein